MMKLTIINFCIIFLLLIQTQSNCQTKAFPDAYGFGEYSCGGRGGKVLLVTNLNDNGAGSLREAIKSKGPRTIVFEVAGVIELDSTLELKEPFVTIAGNSAPGDGICLKNFGMVLTRTHNVIIRYLRIRPGSQKGVELDALSINSSQNVIIDHCSLSWGTDEVLSVTQGGSTNISVQWCFINEGLNKSVHHKGEHGYGSLLRIDGNLSFHHNFYSNNNSRNPRIGTYGDFSRGGFVDFRNNLVYNWGQLPAYTAEDKATINFINNYYKAGNSTADSVKEIIFHVGGNTTSLYISGNILEGFEKYSSENKKLVRVSKYANVNSVFLPLPIQVSQILTEDPLVAKEKILKTAGAILPQRDFVDKRLVTQFISNTGKIVDDQNQTGGWPQYKFSNKNKDMNRNGIDDNWEAKYKLNSSDNNIHNADIDNDGYTNLEEFLNGTNPLIKK